MVDTAMQTWVREEGNKDNPQTRAYFADAHERGALLTPEFSAGRLIERLAGDETGQTWFAADPK
jgi:hypothetical protein